MQGGAGQGVHMPKQSTWNQFWPNVVSLSLSDAAIVCNAIHCFFSASSFL